MTKKVWHKPELRQIQAGGAENGSIKTSVDAKGTPNTGS